jgi:hypothetical protein
MKSMTYRELGHRLNQHSFGEGWREARGVGVELEDVVNILVEFFRANDPNFDEGEFIGSTYGA